MEGDGKRVEKAGRMGITMGKITVDTRKQGKVTLLFEMASCSRSCFSSVRLAGFTGGYGLGH